MWLESCSRPAAWQPDAQLTEPLVRSRGNASYVQISSSDPCGLSLFCIKQLPVHPSEQEANLNSISLVLIFTHRWRQVTWSKGFRKQNVCHKLFLFSQYFFCFQVPQCVKDLFPSAWNPPPGPRRLAGFDTNYLALI